MLFERVVSSGLAHYSYLIADRNDAIVIDPRRDCDSYIEMASDEGASVRYVLETHRNEDFVVGSVELSMRTGAEIWHADGQWDYRYGKQVSDGKRWKIGRVSLEAIHSPGHTPGMMNYLLRDPSGVPWMVFTGDTLFAGEVGRIDLLGMDRAPEMAGLLYDSIFEKLLPLGDEVIVCPAHGAGSVCGESIADRLWTTIGIERKNNPRLRFSDKENFVENLLKSQPERPPYFRRMERLNLEGAPLLGSMPMPRPMSSKEFSDIALKSDSNPAGQNDSTPAFVLDTRMELGFGAAHVGGAQNIWLDGLASFEGWYVPYDRPLLLVIEGDDPKEAVRILIREGYDNIAGFLAGGMLSWHMSGHGSQSIRMLTVQEICAKLDRDEKLWILDVRSEEELEKDGRIQNAQHIHVTRIPGRMDEVPKDRPIYVFCGSGMRSMIAASFLQKNGWKDLAVVLGGLAGWRSARCPVDMVKS